MSDFRYTRPDSFPPIVKNLIIINALVFLAQITLNITDKVMLYPILPEGLQDYLVQARHPNYTDGQHFQPYQIATHMFAHSPSMIFHIVFNMFGLYMFGRVLENVWGPQRFLIFYFACGIGAAFAHLAMQYFRAQELMTALTTGASDWMNYIGAASPALGASGAVMGIFAAFAYLFPNTELFIMFIPFPIKAKWAVTGLIAIDLIWGVGQFGGDNVARFAHLGGALTGFIIVLIWNKMNKKRFY